MKMNTCSECRGLVPESTPACPHCDAPVGSVPLLRRAAQTTLGSAFAMTLMACYGAPGGYEDDDGPRPGTTNLDRACGTAITVDGGANEISVVADATSGDESNLSDACGYAPGPERVFYYDPGTTGSEPGEFVITSNLGREHALYVLSDCYDDQSMLACEPNAEGAGELRFPVSRLEPFYIVVDSTREGQGSDIQFEVRFEPAAARP